MQSGYIATCPKHGGNTALCSPYALSTYEHWALPCDMERIQPIYSIDFFVQSPILFMPALKIGGDVFGKIRDD